MFVYLGALAILLATKVFALTSFEQFDIPEPLPLPYPGAPNSTQFAVSQLSLRDILSPRQSSCYYPNGWCSSGYHEPVPDFFVYSRDRIKITENAAHPTQFAVLEVVAILLQAIVAALDNVTLTNHIAAMTKGVYDLRMNVVKVQDGVRVRSFVSSLSDREPEDAVLT